MKNRNGNVKIREGKAINGKGEWNWELRTVWSKTKPMFKLHVESRYNILTTMSTCICEYLVTCAHFFKYIEKKL